jgi:dCTP deaminase
MILSDIEIIRKIVNKEIVITPMIDPARQIGSSSVDLRLGTQFKVIKITKQAFFDPEKDISEICREVANYTETIHVAPMEQFILHPKEFALGSTLEYVKLPSNLAGRLEGRSTWGRVGLQIHSTAAFVDPGFEGTIVFELYNGGKVPLPLVAGIRIAQISFQECHTVAVPYSRKSEAKYAKRTDVLDGLFYNDPEYRLIQKYLSLARKDKLKVELLESNEPS